MGSRSVTGLGENAGMDDAAWMVGREVRCRCGQTGVVTGVEAGEDQPVLVWVSHDVRGAVQAHIHRSPQMAALLTQLAR